MPDASHIEIDSITRTVVVTCRRIDPIVRRHTPGGYRQHHRLWNRFTSGFLEGCLLVPEQVCRKKCAL